MQDKLAKREISADQRREANALSLISKLALLLIFGSIIFAAYAQHVAR